MADIIRELIKDIPNVETCYVGDGIEHLTVKHNSNKSLCVCLEEYFFRIANEDEVYERFMSTMRQIRKPLQKRWCKYDLVESLISAIKSGEPMIGWSCIFVHIVHCGLELKDPVCALQRRSFTL